MIQVVLLQRVKFQAQLSPYFYHLRKSESGSITCLLYMQTGVGELGKQQRQEDRDGCICVHKKGIEAQTSSANDKNAPKSNTPSAVIGGVQVRVIPQEQVAAAASDIHVQSTSALQTSEHIITQPSALVPMTECASTGESVQPVEEEECWCGTCGEQYMEEEETWIECNVRPGITYHVQVYRIYLQQKSCTSVQNVNIHRS